MKYILLNLGRSVASDPELRKDQLLTGCREPSIFPQTEKRNMVIGLAAGSGFEPGREEVSLAL